jgi:hypothetical protein
MVTNVSEEPAAPSGSMFLRNVSNHLPNYTALFPEDRNMKLRFTDGKWFEGRNTNFEFTEPNWIIQYIQFECMELYEEKQKLCVYWIYSDFM